MLYVSKIYQEVFMWMNFLQTKPQIKKMNFNYIGLFYTVIKVRDENMDIDNQYEDDDKDWIEDFITPNHYVGIKPRETFLRYRKMRSVLNDYDYR